MRRPWAKAAAMAGLFALLAGACTLTERNDLSGGGNSGSGGADGGGGKNGNCPAGYLDCDGVSANGCETYAASDPKNCGKCGNACWANNNLSPICNDGQCGTSNCTAPSLDCDSDPATCETNSQTSIDNCGFCGNACKFANATAKCVNGACQLDSCDANHADCDGLVTNGCEATLDTLTDCGACGTACAPSNATASCASGKCSIASCNSGYSDCDGDPANGCEALLDSDPKNCGTCGNACAANLVCKAGKCSQSNCTAPMQDCDTDPATCETDVSTSLQNCGFCGNVCNLPNATPACSAGNCAIQSCNAGYADCDGIASNGCETSLGTAANCKSCGDQCSGKPHVASGTCVSSACTIVCSAGYGDCDGNPSNGCEVDFSNDPLHCGGCSKVCATQPHSSPSCNAGTCGMTCNAGYADCLADGGCETNVLTTSTSCGACGRACVNGGVCTNGFCPIEVLSSQMPNARALADLDSHHILVGRMPGGLYNLEKTNLSVITVDANASVIAVVRRNSYAYWADPSAGIFRKYVSGSGSATTLSTQTGVYSLDDQSGTVFFTSLQGLGLGRVPESGAGGVTVLDATTGSHGVKQSGTRLFYAMPALNEVRNSDTNGNQAPAFTGQSTPESIDADTSSVYWTNNGNGTVYRAPAGGGAPVQLATGYAGVFALSQDGINVYFTTDSASGALYRVPIAGGTVVKLADGLVNPRAVVAGASYVYWAEFGSGIVARTTK